MSVTPLPDLSVQLTQRRWRCVLDPNLALSVSGAEFARRLAAFSEVWLGTEFFNVLDSARIYQKEPELLSWPDIGAAQSGRLRETLGDWVQLRNEAGYGGSPLHWIGHVLRESCLPPNMSDDVVGRWEAATRSLDDRLPRAIEASGPLVATMRDTVALSAALPAAIVTLQHPGEIREPPALCQHIARWGVVCERLPDDDDLVAIERDRAQRALVQAGLSEFIWAGLNVSIVHIHAPGVGRLHADHDVLASPEDDELTLLPPYEEGIRPWVGAKAFWYPLRLTSARLSESARERGHVG